MYTVITYPIDPVFIHLINAVFYSIKKEGNNFLYIEEVENIPTIFKEIKCSICLNAEHKFKKLKCKHLFCEKCITKWLTSFSNTCPICRTVLN